MQSKCPRNKLHIFSISKAWNELHKQWKKRKTSPKPLEPIDGRGIKDLHKCGEEMSKNSSIPSQEQQENKWAEWLGRGEREGDKGPKAFCPGWRHQPGQKAHVPPASPASRWTRDKSHLLSRAQRLPGQMAWNKGLFCSSCLSCKALHKCIQPPAKYIGHGGAK